ncbi:MAG: methyltransferase domain-containing protein [Nitrospirae bacterium]|nr:methyltransferase domain-containing protein [Nitrospirota bacterium]
MTDEDLIGLRRLYSGFMTSRIILTANNLGVFESLKETSTAAEVAGKTETDARAMEILLDALTGIGLIIKSRNGKYRNAPVSTRYLVKDASLYQGDIVRHASGMWEGFSLLDEVVRTGSPAKRKRDHEAFIMGMHNLTILRTESLIKVIGLNDVKTMLDLGGGPGTNAMAMVKKGVKATIFDLPETISIARKVARRDGTRGIRFIAGDFHTDSIGAGYDLILLSQIFHAFSIKENIALLQKCMSAINPGGRVVVQEFPINEARTAPQHSAVFSVNMLVNTEKGRCYSPKEIKQWLSETGFKKIVVKKTPETICIEGKRKD